jgi:hypothetical protein
VSATNLGDEVYALDNATITLTSVGTSKIGRVWGFYKASFEAQDTSRVFVEVY